jgi:hypothetical protein
MKRSVMVIGEVSAGTSFTIIEICVVIPRRVFSAALRLVNRFHIFFFRGGSLLGRESPPTATY